MNRRAFLGSLGAVASAGILSRQALASDEPIRVRVWLSDRAATYPDLPARVRGYLRAALAPIRDVRVVFADRSVDLPAEDGREVLANHWPARLAKGAVGHEDVSPTVGVNLLVTDGDITTQPAGFARPYVAAATGAKHVAHMPAAAETPETVPYSYSSVATQLLLHECGHALGLTHGHGTGTVVDDAVVASPMVGGYLWTDAETRAAHVGSPDNQCGQSYPSADDAADRRLRLRFSDCARAALEGSIQPAE